MARLHGRFPSLLRQGAGLVKSRRWSRVESRPTGMVMGEVGRWAVSAWLARQNESDLVTELLGDHASTGRWKGLQLSGVHQRRGLRLVGAIDGAPDQRAVGGNRVSTGTPGHRPKGMSRPLEAAPSGSPHRPYPSSQKSGKPSDQLRSDFRALSRSRSPTPKAMAPIGLLHRLTGRALPGGLCDPRRLCRYFCRPSAGRHAA